MPSTETVKTPSADTEGEAFLASSAFENASMNDDGQAAKQHLAAGHPIYYVDPAYPGQIVRKFPDGRRQIVVMLGKGQVEVVRELAT